MDLLLKSGNIIQESSVAISGSKSETNRLLLLQALYRNLTLKNISDSDDSQVMIAAFENTDNRQPTTNNFSVNIHHAGTAMRFLTAYFAIQQGKTVVLTGSDRMKERPIKILVEALQQLGADISYTEKRDFPPLRITGKKLTQNKVSVSAAVSSQYISALLLIAPQLENGLQLMLEGEITSRPYIDMTLGLLDKLGITTTFEGNTIQVKPANNNRQPKTLTIESDWSSASYYYSIVALSQMGTALQLSTFKKDSLQGDAILAEIYRDFGVSTKFMGDIILLVKTDNRHPTTNSYHLNHNPDLAQTIAVTAFGLGISCNLSGLHTLKIKETDRLHALQNELQKLGAEVSISDDSLTLEAAHAIKPNIKIATYQDHRMAMAFAPLAVRVPIVIENAEVVSKSYPAFWDDLAKIGFKIEQV